MDDEKPSMTVDGEEVALKSEDEKKAEIDAIKANLKAKLERGEINGAEYNKQLIDLTVPKKEEEIKFKKKEKGRTKTIIIIVIFILISSIPGCIYLNWRFYFQNTLTAESVPDYSHEFKSTINDDPIQIEVSGEEKGEYKGRPIEVTYKDYYDITGIVTSVRDYWNFDDYDSLVPRDVCLAWGDMAKAYRDQKADFTQGERNCRPIIDGEVIEDLDSKRVRGVWGNWGISIRNFSNNHIIPSTAEIRSQIFDLKAGDTVRLTGYLVTVHYGNIILSSSITRDDTGNGACEVFYVISVEKTVSK